MGPTKQAREQAAGATHGAEAAPAAGRRTLVDAQPEEAGWEPISGGGGRGEGSAEGWTPAPTVHAMDAGAERETDIKSHAIGKSAAGTPSRRIVGIGEPIDLTGPSAGTWSAPEVGPGGKAAARGPSYRWVAPDHATTTTITLKPDKKGATESTISFRVIEPEDQRFKKTREANAAEMKGHRVAGGMRAKVDLLPETVSFDACEWMEMEGGPTNPTGFFKGVTPPSHEPALAPVPVGAGISDLAVYFNPTMPSSGGTFDWVIPTFVYVPNGSSQKELKSTQSVEVFGMSRVGHVQVSKRGETTAAAISEIRQPGGAPIQTNTPHGGGAHGCGNREGADKTPVTPAPTTTPVVANPTSPDPIPPEYAKMDRAAVEILFRSQGPGDVLGGKELAGKPFWDRMKTLDVAQLQSLAQIVHGARNVKLLDKIDRITRIYTNESSSWGIFFHTKGDLLSVVAHDWGKDWPMGAVRAAHQDSTHDWYRHNGGAGKPGMHLGIDTAGNPHDLHWDPTNPMSGVTTGLTPNKSMLAKMPGLFDLMPAGMAIYDPVALVQHEVDIGKIKGKAAELLKSNKPPGATSEPFKSITKLSDMHVTNMKASIEREEVHAKDRHQHEFSSQGACKGLRDAIAEIEAFAAMARPIAMQDHSDDKKPVEDLQKQFDTLLQHTFAHWAQFHLHLEAELPTLPPQRHRFSQVAKWHIDVDGGLIWNQWVELDGPRVELAKQKKQ